MDTPTTKSTTPAKPGSVTHTLAYPYDFKGAKITSVTLRRASKKDLSRATAAAKGSDDLFQTALLSNLVEVDPAFFDDMDASDYFAIGKLLEGFLSSKKEAPAQ